MKGIQLDRDHWSYCNHDVSRQNATEANRPEENPCAPLSHTHRF